MKTPLAAAAALAALMLAAPAHADPRDGYRGWDGPRYADYGRDRTDADRLRERQQRLADQIREGMREGWLDRYESGRAWSEFRRIRQETERELQVHGPYLPREDRREIFERMGRLADYLAREEHGDRRGYGGGRRW